MTGEGPIGWTSYEPLDGPLSGELHDGVVREWHDEEGWGVIDSPKTPGGCWTHFSAIVSAGYRHLRSGAFVAFTSEGARQDGYSYRAVQVFPRGNDVGPQTSADTPGAYQSTLTITVDGEAVDPEPILRQAEREAARARLGILDAIVSAGDRRDDVMAVIAEADSTDGAREAVAELLGVTDAGATAVLDLQLRRFSHEAMQRLRAERDELRGLSER
jgi:CspA family cold shock protein